MIRVTDNEVKKIIDTNRDTSIFIDQAHLVVTEELLSKGLSEDRLRSIELYLAAHFTALTEERGGLTKFKVGDATEEYMLVKGSGFAGTRYGQMAMDMDTTGTLTTISNNAKRAEFRVV